MKLFFDIVYLPVFLIWLGYNLASAEDVWLDYVMIIVMSALWPIQLVEELLLMIFAKDE